MSRQTYTGEERRRNGNSGIRFDKTINLGHVLTFVGFIISGMVAWSTLDKRVVVLEESRKMQEMRDIAQDQRANDERGVIRETLVEIKQAVKEVQAAVGRKP